MLGTFLPIGRFDLGGDCFDEILRFRQAALGNGKINAGRLNPIARDDGLGDYSKVVVRGRSFHLIHHFRS